MAGAALAVVALTASGALVDVAAPASSTVISDGSASATLAQCPSSTPVSSLPLFVRTSPIPDDLTVAPDGDVWVGIPSQGHILVYTPSGTLRQDLPGFEEPEGIIVTAGGQAFVAEQLASRIDRLPAGGHPTRFLPLPDPGHQLPVDGLGFDVQHNRLLVPNSPQGTLFETPIDVARPRLLSTGLGRPVAADIGPDGAIYVAAESKAGLLRIPARGGRAKRVGALTNLDEVLRIGDLLYTTGAGDHTVRAVDPKTGGSRVLAAGGHQLQGLTALPDGRLLVVDSLTHTISFVPSCG